MWNSADEIKRGVDGGFPASAEIVRSSPVRKEPSPVAVAHWRLLVYRNPVKQRPAPMD